MFNIQGNTVITSFIQGGFFSEKWWLEDYFPFEGRPFFSGEAFSHISWKSKDIPQCQHPRRNMALFEGIIHHHHHPHLFFNMHPGPPKKKLT